jgi:hypothetical protein
MNYEQAPATKLLATHCAVCGRPLVDARSVELGIGPDCRKKHGYNEADGPCDWPAVLDTLGNSDLAPLFIDDKADESRRLANLVVHHIAAAPTSAGIPNLINALRALGFQKLSNRIAERLCIVKIEVTRDYISVVTPYSERAVECMRLVPGRRWDRDSKSSLVPVAAKPELWRALQLAFPGERGIGPDGIFTIPGRKAS